MTDEIAILCSKAVTLLQSLSKNSRIRVISHYDADGITSAGIICTALYNAGYDFHTSLMRNPFDKGFKRISKEKNDLLFFLDMGSGQLDMIEKLETNAIILDHHQFLRPTTSTDIIQINANTCGINGNYEACGATLSYVFSTSLNTENEQLAPLALTGAIGDKQHIGGFRGLNKTILNTSLAKKQLTVHKGSKLYGESIFDALYYSIDPFFKGISGNKKGVFSLLEYIRIPASILPSELSDEQLKKLNSVLLLKLLKTGVTPAIIDIVFRPRFFTPMVNCELERFADLLDACGKNDARGLGLSICLGNQTDLKQAINIEKEYKTKILTALQSLTQNQYEETESFYYFYSTSSSLGGVVAGIAINYIFDGEKPLFSIAKKEHEIHVSCRGTQAQVEKGLDLGQAMKTVTEKLEGFGGGHKIAAGATIKKSKEKDFLSHVTLLIENQMKKNT